MTPLNFIYWLQGFLELKEAGSEKVELDKEQIDSYAIYHYDGSVETNG